MESGGRVLAALVTLALLGGALADINALESGEIREYRPTLSDSESTPINFTEIARQLNLSFLEEYKPIIDFLPKALSLIPGPASFAVGMATGAALSWYVFAEKPEDIELEPQHPENDTEVVTHNLTYVLVVGKASDGVKEVLGSQEAKEKGINQTGIESGYLRESVLAGYDIAVLQGDPYFDMNAREAINDYVNGGGSLIVVGDAGSRHPEYQNVAGWAWPAGQGIPVPAEMVGWVTGDTDLAEGSDFRFAMTTHPIVKGLKIVGYSTDEDVEVVKTISRGTTIAVITTDEGTLPAIVEGGIGLGKVVYFSYDPGETPEIFLQAINYLK